MTENKERSQVADPGIRGALVFFCVVLILGFGVVATSWRARGEPKGHEAQTLLPAHFIQQTHNFSPAYPTLALGRQGLIPAEFPLYQWTAVGLSDLTRFELLKAGRALGLLCFYLTLPALFLVLRDSGLTPAGGLVAIGTIVGNIFCLNQAATFQAESMALMFAAWFLAGMVHGLATGRRGWFWLAIVAGGAAGVLNGRTLLVFQLLALGWSAGWFWRHRQTASSGAASAWWWAVTLLPWLAVGSWLHYAAGVRHPNVEVPFRSLIGREGLGLVRPDFSSDLMGRQLELIGAQVVWWPLLVAGAVLAITFSERWWRQVVVCTAGFFVTRLLFPVLLEPQLHEVMAGTICLLIALGLVLVGLFDAALPRWTGWVGLLLFCAGLTGQIYRVHPTPGAESPLASRAYATPPAELSLEGLGKALRQAVPSDAYLVNVAAPVSGLQLPLAARRRTLSLLPGEAENEASLTAALAAMGQEPLGAVILDGNTTRPDNLVAEMAKLTGRELQLAFTYREWTVYLPKAGLKPAVDELVMAHLLGVVVAPGILPDPQLLVGEWKEPAKLWRFQRAIFQGMQPTPVSFYSTFGPSVMGDGTEEWYNAHPITRLRFQLPPGPHRLRTRVMIKPEAFDPSLPPEEMTDGVEFQLAAIDAQENHHVLHSRLIDPVHNAADRQPQAIDLQFTLPADTELEIFFGPGPARRSNRDWIYLGSLRID